MGEYWKLHGLGNSSYNESWNFTLVDQLFTSSFPVLSTADVILTKLSKCLIGFNTYCSDFISMLSFFHYVMFGASEYK